jgi:peptidoglycan/xylan/chitin deacetylase (PgdA/CDA1 family)
MRNLSHLLQRTHKITRSWLLSAAAISLLPFAALTGHAAEAQAASSSISAADQELYAQLASGDKVLQRRDYAVPEQPTVYLTFDDGPSKLTPKVLDILKNEDVKATFFELGGEVESYPDIARRVVKEGHALGNHTYDHVYGELYGSFDEFWRQVQATDNVFADVVGFRPRLLRAPGGTAANFDAFYFYYLDQAGYSVFDWNIDSGDSKRAGVPAKEIIDTVKQGPFPHEVTVLMHDGSGHGETVKALPDIIRIFKEKGYAFGTLTEQVQPAQFPVKKTKWGRSMPLAKFGKLAAEVRSVGEQRLAEASPSGASGCNGSGGACNCDDESSSGGGSRACADVGAVQVAVAAEAPAPKPEYNDVPLRLRYASGDVVLPAGGYELKRGTLHVPLRQLAERLGGAVSWDEGKRTATVRYGLRELRYEIGTKTLRIYSLGKLQISYPYADMQMENGTVYVPLRSTAALLGGGIGDWSMQRDGRFVDMEQRLGPVGTVWALFSAG